MPALMEDTGEFNRTRWYTLYSTPEGLKIHEHETVVRGSIERQPGQRSAELEEVGARLFTEDELQQERPETVEFLLDRD